MKDTIVLTGGGSGGHITPLLAVASELKSRDASLNIVYIGQTGDKLADIPAKHPEIDQVYTVRAGKWRRYHGEGFKQLLDLPTMFKNIRDVFYVIIGIYQSRNLLKTLQPEVIFIKGGFVGVPLGVAAGGLHIPYITHDSDAIPGLANRLISKKATLHAVALPKDTYAYPANKTVTTGIPLQAGFEPVDDNLKKSYRKQLGIPDSSKLVFVIGGGLGSQRVNKAVSEAIPHLLAEYTDLRVIHAVGRANESAMKTTYSASVASEEQGRVEVKGYIDDVYRYSGAADLVITRAGATNLAEFALQGKPCVVIPSPFLAGGHQLKNAKYLEQQGAAVILSESDLADDPNRLARQVSELLADNKRRDQLGSKFASFGKPNATSDIATLILEQIKNSNKDNNNEAAPQ